MNDPKKRLGIYFSSPGVLDYPLSKKIYVESYAEIIEALAEKGIETVIIRADSYDSGNTFSRHSVWNGETYEEVNEPVSIDLLWNRDDKNVIPDNIECRMFNSAEFDELCRDKWKTYSHLSDFCPKTFLINSFEEYQEHVAELSGDLVVLKPHDGEQATGVHVIDPSQVTADLYDSWDDILLQNFLDSTGGVPGLYDGTHEVNINMVNGEFAGARIKKLHPGTWISCASIGGCDIEGLTADRLPADLMEFVHAVDGELTQWTPRMYRIDIIHSPEGYKIVEINSRPGVMHPEKEGEYYWDFNGRLVEMFVEELI